MVSLFQKNSLHLLRTVWSWRNVIFRRQGWKDKHSVIVCDSGECPSLMTLGHTYVFPSGTNRRKLSSLGTEPIKIIHLTVGPDRNNRGRVGLIFLSLFLVWLLLLLLVSWSWWSVKKKNLNRSNSHPLKLCLSESCCLISLLCWTLYVTKQIQDQMSNDGCPIINYSGFSQIESSCMSGFVDRVRHHLPIFVVLSVFYRN